MTQNSRNILKEYYHLAKPGIVYGNVMTAAAGFFLASRGEVNIVQLLLLLLGTALIIASACVFNNYIDRGIDAKMKRTKKRATVTGTIDARTINIYATVLGILGFAILSYTNRLTFSVGVAAFFSYVVLYGIAKRKTIHGTLVGTLPGAASLVAGYTAVTNTLDLGAFLLFLIMLTWQMAHFYSISIFRFREYALAGLPVMSVVKGVKTTKFQIMLYVFAFVIASVDLSLFGYAGITYLAVISIIGLYWLWKAINGFKSRNDRKWAVDMFGFSLIVLLVFSLLISVDSFLP